MGRIIFMVVIDRDVFMVDSVIFKLSIKKFVYLNSVKMVRLLIRFKINICL